MGGKHKQANRTKNNARPSSSSHTAELLGSNIPTFFGLSAVKDGTTVIPGFSTDDFDYNIDSNFQLVLKKMNKKDSTTKLKALQEFTELCKNSEVDAVKTILPFWPRLYCLLCTDVEHRVREAAHNAQRAVISKVKRSIAPYLKQIAGPWFTSQYDTYPPAASAATLAFQEAFSAKKLNEAIAFCQEEILNYIYDNLIIQTPQTLSPPKTSPEEMEAKYQRVIIASLQGYSLYLQKLSSEQIQQAEANNKKLLSSQKFWKYSKHKAPAVRNSFYNALISLCQNAKFLLAGESAHVSSAIFNNLDESDPMVLPNVWDAALNALVVIEDCWSFVNLEKQVFPKLYLILKDGGRGNGAAIFPNILPLLSKLPDDLIKDKNLFYGNLFENMRIGLESSSVNQSHSEGKIIATTFVECLKYVIMCHRRDVELCNALISNSLIKSIDEKLTSPNALNKSVTSPLFSQISSLLRYWHRNRSTVDLEYEPIFSHFLISLQQLFEKTINEEVSETTLKSILNNQMEFLTILKNPNKSAKIKGRVKFAEEKTSTDETEISKNEPDDTDFLQVLFNLVKKIAALYLKKTIEAKTNLYLPYLNKITEKFDSKIVFEEFKILFNQDSLFKLYSAIFSKWMEDEKMRNADVVDLSFNLLQHVSQNEKEIILKDVNEKWFDDELQYDICRILVKYSDDKCVRGWIRSKDFEKSILELTRKFVGGAKDNSASRDVIIQFFKSKTENDELIIGSSTAESIINIVSENIRKCGKKKHVNELAQDLVFQASSSGQFYPKSFENLVSSLFKLSCSTLENEKLLESFKTGSGFIIRTSRCQNLQLTFTQKLADVVKEIILSENSFHLEHIISIINTYIDLAINSNLSDGSSSNSDIEDAIEIIRTFLKDPVEISKWRRCIKKSIKIAFENRGDWDIKFQEMKFKTLIKKVNEESFNKMAEDLVVSFADEYASSSSLKFMNFSQENLDKILKYRRCYNLLMEVNDDDVISPQMITKYAKWNLFTGSLINLIVSAHPKCYKNYLLKEWNVFYTNDEELNAWKEDDKNSDFIPIKISVEEKEEMEQDLKITEEEFGGSDYEEKNNIIPICNNIFDFIFSVGMLSSFSQFYSGTKYHRILQDPLKKLKKLGDDVIRNANALESLFCYYSVKYFVANEEDYRMVLPTLKEIFHRNFVEEKMEIGPEYINNFVKGEVANRIVTVDKLLKIWYLAANSSEYVSEENWHEIFIFVDKFFEGVKDKDEFSETDMPVLSAVSRLHLQLIKCFKENHLRPPEERISPEVCLAWNEVVESDLYNKFFSIWLKLSEKYFKDEKTQPENIAIFENISQIILSSLSLRKTNTPDESIELLKQCGQYITSPHAVFQITSFKLLLQLVPDLVKLDTEIFCSNISQVSTNTKEGSSLFKKNADCNWTCKNLEEFIISNQTIVETLLSDFIIGDCCTVEPFTDSYCYTYSYLLLWCFLLEICGEAHSPLRFQYGCWLKEKGYSDCLLESVFKLMPQAVLHGSEAKENCVKYFENHASLDFTEPVKSERIEQTACFVYRMFLQRLPNVVRNWWSQAENKTAALVDKITSLYVSPILILNELKSVQLDQDGGFENVEIKTYPNAREVVATYTIDEVKMDLMMTLPQNHPLSPIKIDPSNVVVSTSNWRNLQFLISKYLINQNGTIWGALVIWKNYLDKKFEGVEECYICFSILQGATHDIPKLCCHTCRKKFHSHCLFKWFSTSNKSTCPICRNLF